MNRFHDRNVTDGTLGRVSTTRSQGRFEANPNEKKNKKDLGNDVERIIRRSKVVLYEISMK